MESTASTTELADNVKEWTKALDTLVSENMEIAGTIDFKDGVVEIDKARQEKFSKNLSDIKSLRGLIEGADATLHAKSFLDGAETTPIALLAAMQQMQKDNAPTPYKSIGQMFVESEPFKELAGGQNGYSMRVPWEGKIADIAGRAVMGGSKDVYSDLPSGTPGVFGTIQRDPLVPIQNRRTRVRDLFPIQQTNSPVIQFFRQTGFTNNASPVYEYLSGAFGTKPQSTIAFEGVQTTVKTIANWEAASRNVLADEPQLQGLIDTELLYGLQLAEDYQILSGTGTGEDLLGILTDTDLQQYHWSSGKDAAATGTVGDNKLDAIRRAITLVTLAYFEATGVVMHDDDWEDCELQKDKNGQYLLITSIAQGGQSQTWRLPVVTTPAIPQGTALVGAFGLGAQLYDREQPTIRIAEQHADFFVKNGVVVLAEERLALAVKRPEAFVKVTFDHAPA